MMNDSNSTFEATPLEKLTVHFSKLQRQYQQTLDRWTPHVVQRWLAMGGLFTVFILRIVLSQGVSIVFFY